MSDQQSRAYTSAELNDLMSTLRQLTNDLDPNVQVLLTMATLLEQIHEHGLFMNPEWGVVVPVLHHEILRRTALAISGGMPVDNSSADLVH